VGYVNMKTAVTKQELLDSLNKQLVEQEKTASVAQQRWQDKMVKMAQAVIDAGPKLRKYPRALRALQYPPESHAKELKEIIERIARHTDDVITLETEAYNQMMLGQWGWRSSWNHSNQLYGATGVTGPTGGTGYDDEDGDDLPSQEIEPSIAKDELEE